MAVSAEDKVVRGGDLPVIGNAVRTAMLTKQDRLSTVNVTVTAGSGDPSGSATVSGGTLSLTLNNVKTPVVDDLTTGGTGSALSAEQGKNIKNVLDSAVYFGETVEEL
jgi:hypothetical protein